ncbi:MAG TPA: UDP-N-acetylmuramoyl-L-alanyl-D-glutamate--2,6-diaminopimelate ligase [Tepidisphaeraceae bacterium]|nr:UDP-N-acetylmuramoyl-L-alanyl-D-glutamate--2,6-diaminopimelate ligase [Tepidisphaeraceae bacterium]
MLSLHALLRQFDPQFSLSSVPDSEVTGVREDSRLVTPGDLFVARGGTKTDGAKYIADAKARGAVAVVCESKIPSSPLPCVVVKDAGAAASVLANLYHGSPSTMMRVFGVTGTNGKTTTTYLIRHLLAKVNQRCGMIGTVEIDDGRTRREAEMTTPAACDIAALLATMSNKGCRAVAMETSSHALDQGRVAGVQFAGAAFTNLTGDHLDYHKTMEHYAAAKAELFASLDAEAVAVVNADDKWSDRMIQDCCSRIIRFGFGKKADYRARDIAVTATGSNFILHTPDGRAEVAMPMIGKHNIENALAAAALVGEVCGLSVHQIARGLSDCHGAPGRLQPVRAGQPFAVLVDYAHTDDALENVLSSLRPLCRNGGRLRVVFGCGGDRDRTKRPRMAKIAERLADEIYITSDNPRTENPQRILDEIVAGLSADTDKLVCVEQDRRMAIQRVLSDAAPGDIVLIAGKGHENYQILGKEKHHFDDVEEAMRALGQKTAA